VIANSLIKMNLIFPGRSYDSDDRIGLHSILECTWQNV
jgi:hypothetical protein